MRGDGSLDAAVAQHPALIRLDIREMVSCAAGRVESIGADAYYVFDSLALLEPYLGVREASRALSDSLPAALSCGRWRTGSGAASVCGVHGSSDSETAPRFLSAWTGINTKGGSSPRSRSGAATDRHVSAASCTVCRGRARDHADRIEALQDNRYVVASRPRTVSWPRFVIA